MKLWLCYASAIDYDPTGLVVAETEELAEKKFSKSLDDEGIWHTGKIFAIEITEVDGYGIELMRKPGKILEKQ